ncbi:MAG: phage major capsid protein, partial [Rhizobiales bacterium]|nr:phage major capsid protein [Hyphomicrobiales bacterium]
MPMKPHKGESQSDFLSRCVPDMMGDGKREQDQAVAACLTIWREDKGEKPPPGKAADMELVRLLAQWRARKDDDDDDGSQPYGDVEYADPGYRSDGKKRYPVDTEDHIRAAWNYINKPKNAAKYKPADLAKVKAKIVAAWKDKIDPKGPPSAADKAAMAKLAAEVRAYVLKQDYAPDPDPDESHDDYIERCVDELTDDRDMDEDDAEEACQLAWDESDNARSANALIIHKQHGATEGDDPLEFVLSDATPDRFGDIVEPKGWEIESFLKNPIALFNHDRNFPIGKWENLRTGDTDLRAHLVLAPKGTSPRHDEIRRLIEAGILRASSVGFRPLAFEPINSNDRLGMLGTRYLKAELVETSVVAIPANPNALAVAKSLNISADTVRMVFGEHASKQITRMDANAATRGEHANKQRRGAKEQHGEHAERNQSSNTGKPMLLSKRIQDAERLVVALQDQLTQHLETIDDAAPTEEQMLLTEDLSAKIESASRNLNNLKAIEARNAGTATDAGAGTHGKTNGSRAPADLQLRAKAKPEPLDYFFRAAVVRAFSKSQGQSIDDMRKKLYGDDEVTRVVCDYTLKAASAPALTTVTGWAAELVQQIYADFMQVLLPMSVFPRLAQLGLSLTFGAAGRIIIPTRNLTPSISGSFVGEGQPIPVRQGSFASQTLTPKKMAVITTWTREMDEHSIPAIEGLLRQAVLEDTAISLDTILLDANPATVIRPPGLRNYQAGIAASTAGVGFPNFVADYKALYGALLQLTNGNVRKPALIVNPIQTLDIDLIQPPNAATPLFPFIEMTSGGKVLKASLIESSTVTPGLALMVDAADFTTAGQEGPRLEISDQATLHMEDTTP